MASLAVTYPLYFDLTQIPYPSSFNLAYETVENTYTSEAGTDLAQVTRYRKKQWDMSFKVMDSVVRTLESFADKDSFTFKYYDIRTQAYAETTVRLRDFQQSLHAKTEKLEQSMGLYDVSFKLIEF